MRAPRSSYIAFTKFKKMCDTFRECPNNDITSSASPTRAALATVQTYVEAALMQILLIAADNKRGRTLDEAEMTRAWAYANHFLMREPAPQSCATKMCTTTQMPKKLCVHALKKERPTCRVTRGAIGVIANMYKYITRAALLAINNAVEASTKKRVAPEVVDRVLKQLFSARP